jgi:hypothetical protein
MTMLFTLGATGTSFNGTWTSDTVVRIDEYSDDFFGFTIALLGFVHGLDVSADGSVVVGCSSNTVISHNTATGVVLWRKEMLGRVHTLRIHGEVVIVPVEHSNTVVLDVTTGRQLHTLPSAGKDVRGIWVFDGLKSDVNFLGDFLTLCCYLSAANKDSLESV